MGSLSMEGRAAAWMEDTCEGALLLSGRVSVKARSDGLESTRVPAAAAVVGAVIFGE